MALIDLIDLKIVGRRMFIFYAVWIVWEKLIVRVYSVLIRMFLLYSMELIVFIGMDRLVTLGVVLILLFT